jgi:integrase
MMGWLVQARYLVGNPWVLVNRRLGDDPDHDDDVTSRAFTVEAWNALIDYLDRQPPSEATARLRWLCVFGHSVGLRSSELLAAKREDLRHKKGGWLIRVFGKGRRNRTVPVPGQAIAGTRKYFAARCLAFDDAPPATPLIASLIDGAPLTYATLNEVFKRLVRDAIDASCLSAEEKATARQASVHWLRHTYGTRSAEAGVSSDILQENFGHSDPRTTSQYFRAQIERRQAAMQQVFGD